MRRLLFRVRARAIGRLDKVWYQQRGARIAKSAYLAPSVLIDPNYCHLVTIEEGVRLSPDVMILAHDAAMRASVGATWVAPVHVGADAYVGARAVVLPGVRIGRGAVVAAGSLVRSDVPPGTVVGGVPARHLGTVEELATRHEAARRSGLPEFRARSWLGDSDGARSLRQQMQETLDARGGYVV